MRKHGVSSSNTRYAKYFLCVGKLLRFEAPTGGDDGFDFMDHCFKIHVENNIVVIHTGLEFSMGLFQSFGYGNLVIIKHNETYFSAYAHNDKVLVKENENVKSGQRIADMGKSGADKIMLHFEIRRNGKTANPLKYLPKKRS